MTAPVYHLEIGPLKEGNFTGISQVTAALAEQMLGDTARDTQFFFGRARIDHAAVEDMVRRRNGELVEWYLRRTEYRPAPDRIDGTQIAIFPNRKTCRRGFHVDCQIVHDLSTLLTPQFHNRDTIDYHAKTLLEDVRTNDLTFCVSEATRQDVLRYLGPLDPTSVVTMTLAATVATEVAADFGGRRPQPYVLVLGTIEPRKNIHSVLDYIARNRSILYRTRFLFLGRFGWGENFDRLLSQFDLTLEFEAGRIVFPGYVSEGTKNTLLRHAKLLVYPSLFEGFGIPLLEALALGVPAVTTRSSSLPEVGGACCYYFDPFIEGDFDAALARGLVDVKLRPDEIRAACLERAGQFSWPKTYATMMGSIDALLERRAGGPSCRG
jgi:glycosyltransferase involved in cell wall biosynthesis